MCLFRHTPSQRPVSHSGNSFTRVCKTLEVPRLYLSLVTSCSVHMCCKSGTEVAPESSPAKLLREDYCKISRLNNVVSEQIVNLRL